jgi:hypothetical protein
LSPNSLIVNQAAMQAGHRKLVALIGKQEETQLKGNMELKTIINEQTKGIPYDLIF